MPHVTDDDLAVLALGEQLPYADRHLAGCERCRAELAILRATVRTAQSADIDVPPPPPGVWDRITSELGSEISGAPGRRGSGARPVRRARPSRRWAAAAVGLAAALTLGVTGLLLRGDGVDGTGTGTGDGRPAAVLRPLTGPGGGGDVRLVDDRSGAVLQVHTHGLSRGSGFYEVWLIDPATRRVVALGTLDGRGDARLALPAGVRLTDYPEVDVSVEPDDGNPSHSGDSVLRGPRPA